MKCKFCVVALYLAFKVGKTKVNPAKGRYSQSGAWGRKKITSQKNLTPSDLWSSSSKSSAFSLKEIENC